MATPKDLIRSIFRSIGYDIIKYRPDQPGKDIMIDLRKYLKNDSPVIFDAGANEGQTVATFKEEFPNCVMHSFEPSPTTFATLKENTKKFSNSNIYNAGLGSKSDKLRFNENEHNQMSSFLELGEFGHGDIKKETLVDVKTIDQIVEENSINIVDILKSDTQGYDLEIFKGAQNSIDNNKIGMIYFEIIFSKMYENLPTVSELFDFLSNNNFHLIAFYEFFYQEKIASWTDALFVHKSYLTK